MFGESEKPMTAKISVYLLISFFKVGLCEGQTSYQCSCCYKTFIKGNGEESTPVARGPRVWHAVVVSTD